MQEVKIHNVLDQHVVKTLLYYDIFNYPLKGEEVFRFLGMNSITEKDVFASLDSLAVEGLVARHGEYYSMQFDAKLVTRRVRGNRVAKGYHAIAIKRAGFISKFPFVRAVMGSGSLSKDYMDESCDLDFFIVTAPGRLWIARSLLVLYKRLFLNNSHKFFCVNYFIDEAHLEIEEQNLFTATELATVLPLYGAEYYQRLHDQNRRWVKAFLPNYQVRNTSEIPYSHKGVIKRMLETFINLLLPALLERMLMNATLRRWRKLYQPGYTAQDFSIAFKTKEHVSKNHPRNLQKSILQIYKQKLTWFEGRDFEGQP